MTLLEHIEIARSIMREESRLLNFDRIEDATTGMEIMRSLAQFIIALHPEIAFGDTDERIDSLVEVINEQTSDADFMLALFMEARNARSNSDNVPPTLH